MVRGRSGSASGCGAIGRVSALTMLLALWAAAGCSAAVEPVVDDSVILGGPAPMILPQVPVWPRPGARLHPPPLVIRPELQGTWVAVDAGHGAPRNFGANSCRCIDEQDVVLPIAEAVGDALEAAGLRVLRLRRLGEWPTYTTRLRRLAASQSVLMISIHGDARMPADPWMPNLDCEALISTDQPGFSVLWSDEHDDRTEGRRELAHALADSLRQTGLPPYDGRDYGTVYEQTEVGAFVDRHTPRKRIRFLRAPTVPSAIVEVGHLLDPDESERLLEPEVHEILGHAITVGVVEYLSEQGG